MPTVHYLESDEVSMRSMIVLVVLSLTACGEMAASTPEEPTALAQMNSSTQMNSRTWLDKDGNVLPAAEVQEAYRACQDRMISGSRLSTFRASDAMVPPPYDEDVRLAVSDPELNFCMLSFGYSQVNSPRAARGGMKQRARPV
jgi:hypothetical protein